MDMSTQRQRLGLIVPSSNTVSEPDFVRAAPDGVTVHTARAYLADTTEEAERRMLHEHLPQAVHDLSSCYPHAVVFSCTSAAALLGAHAEDELVAGMEEEIGAAVVSTARAVGEVLNRYGSARVAVMTAYTDELNAFIEKSLVARGVNVVAIDGLGIMENFAIAEVTPEDIVTETTKRLSGVDADVLFVSCTNLRALEAIPALEREFGVPVVTSNSAAATVAMERLGVQPGFGTLPAGSGPSPGSRRV